MKYCPNCGAELAPDDKFCTKCGYTLIAEGQSSATENTIGREQAAQNATNDTTQNEPVQANPTVTAVQGYATNYFQWFWDALKRPFTNDDAAQHYFGLINFAIIILLNAISLNTLIQRLEQLSPSLLSEFGIQDKTVSFWLSFIFIGLAIYAVYIGVSYCFSHFGSHNLDQTFLDYTNRVAHYTSTIVVLAIIQFIDSFMVTLNSGIVFYAIIVGLQSVVLLAGCLLSVAPQQDVKPAMDPAYATILTIVVINVLLFIVGDIAAQAVIARIAEIFRDL